ncbi:MAG: FtsW/RodA/SpoVE family cell cycle protein [Myxococcota bacterium]
MQRGLQLGQARTHRARTAFLDPFNIVAFIAILALVGASLLAQSDAAFYAGGEFYEKQTIWIIVGGAVFVLMTIVDLRLVERASWLFYFGCIALLIATRFFGIDVNHSRRWLGLGSFNLQASEFTKLAVILTLARFLNTRRERKPGESEPKQVGRYDLKSLLVPGAVVFVPMLLIMMQPDLGTALMLLFVGATMVAVEGIKRRAVIAGLVGLLIVIPLGWKLGGIREYQKDRVYKMVNADWEKVDPDTGVVNERLLTQGEQGIIAIGTGGFAGQGHRGANPQRLKDFPEIHTDFVSAMVGEEFGFVGLTVVVFLFWWIVMWALRTALDSRSRYCRLVCSGVAALIGWQVFVNIGMVSGIMPVVGVPLPFLSYGGSAMMTILMCLALCFNIALKRGRM